MGSGALISFIPLSQHDLARVSSTAGYWTTPKHHVSRPPLPPSRLGYSGHPHRSSTCAKAHGNQAGSKKCYRPPKQKRFPAGTSFSRGQLQSGTGEKKQNEPKREKNIVRIAAAAESSSCTSTESSTWSLLLSRRRSSTSKDTTSRCSTESITTGRSRSTSAENSTASSCGSWVTCAAENSSSSSCWSWGCRRSENT